MTTNRNLPMLLRWTGFLILCLSLFAPQGLVLAHPVDMFAQQQSITLTQAGMTVDWKITPGPLLADTAWAAADGDHNGAVSSQEARAWIAPFLSGLSIRLDGQRLDNIPVVQRHWPAAIERMRTGEDPIQLQVSIQWPISITGKHRVELHNAHLEVNSLDWFLLNAGPGLSFDTPLQNNGQIAFDLYIPATASTLTSWNSGQPDLAGLGLANDPQNGGPLTATSALVGLVKTQDFSPLFLVGAFLLSLVLGSLHALTPGHGKTLVAAYLVGSRGRSRDAVFLGLVVTLTHTGSVVLLGLLTLLASRYILPGLIAPWLEIVSGLLVIGFGINLFWQRRPVWAARRTQAFSLQNARVGKPPAGFGLLNARADEPHQHGTHTHTHNLPAGELTWKSLLALGVSGGLVPCPDAIAILLVAVAVNRILFGMLLIVAFSVGLALVLIVIGIAMLQGVRLVTRSNLLNRFSVYAPLVSAVVVCGLGVGLTFSAVRALVFASFASTAFAQPFDISRARLLYLSPDSQGQSQLTLLPLSGGAAVSYTDEASSVAGYSVSPDRKTIVYSVFHTDGQTFLWAMDADGTHRRLALTCKQAQCGGPVWYPDGRRLVYQRADYLQDDALARFSLWWLDLASGETRPVFQDGTFASYAPAFSPDGQWLSYKSPSNNTLQVYNLQDGRSISIPIPVQPGEQEVWSPAGDALLFWDSASSQLNSALHVQLYDLNSGSKSDLGGETGQFDYAASWSPDGGWIAIDRSLPDSASSKRGDQVWLTRPDGSVARLLLGEDDASYSDLAWAPDGKSLVYTRYSYQNPGQSEIWQVDIQSGEKTRLVFGGVSPTLLP